MFGQPAFLARLPGGDAQCVALLAQQRVAAVARAVGLDRQLLGEVHDEAAVGIEFAGRMQAAHEGLALRAFTLDTRQRGGAHPRHQPHVGDDVGRVGDLDAAARQRRIDRAHAIGHDVQGASAHAAVEQPVDRLVRLRGRHPVVVGTGVVALAGADEGQVFDARHVLRIGAVQIAPGVGVLVEFDEGAVCQHPRDQVAVLGLAAVAPVDAVGFGQGGDLVHPVVERGKPAPLRRRRLRARNCIHRCPLQTPASTGKVRINCNSLCARRTGALAATRHGR